MPLPHRSGIEVFRSAFQSPEDANSGRGIRPVVFDILAPDLETSILPDNLKMVLHVNPSSIALNYTKVITRIQTKGGFVEQHWGDAVTTISLAFVTGGFMRFRAGLSNITGGGLDKGGVRRDTIAYDKYLDLLALFKNNGSVYDSTGKIVFQGCIKMTFDEGIYLGWFSSFGVQENAEKPYMFDLNAEFSVKTEILRLRTEEMPSPVFSLEDTAPGTVPAVGTQSGKGVPAPWDMRNLEPESWGPPAVFPEIGGGLPPEDPLVPGKNGFRKY